MDMRTLKGLKPRLTAYLLEFRRCIRNKRTRRHAGTYLRGQLGPLEAKSVEPIALEAGVAPRTLQKFLSERKWDEEKLRRRHQVVLQRDHGGENAICVVDETSFPKKGEKTTGVKRQHCGTLGKVDNCVVSVHLGYVREGFHALLDSDVFLPEDWANDPARREEAGVPEDLAFRTKPQIAVDLLRRSIQAGVQMRWLTADALYGRSGAFREAVSRLGLWYVVEVPCSMTGWTKRPRTGEDGLPLPGERSSREVSKLWTRGGPSWERYRIKDTEKGPLVWEVRQTSFHPNDDGRPGAPLTLIVATHVLTGERKYWYSNAPLETPLSELLCVAFSRCHIEQLFEEAKQEVGFDAFEVRTYRALERHFVLSMMSVYFLSEQATRLRGGKPLVEPVPGPQGAPLPTGGGDALAGTGSAVAACGQQDRVLAEAS
jgi:SRSO17 transposase